MSHCHLHRSMYLPSRLLNGVGLLLPQTSVFGSTVVTGKTVAGKSSKLKALVHMIVEMIEVFQSQFTSKQVDCSCEPCKDW